MGSRRGISSSTPPKGAKRTRIACARFSGPALRSTASHRITRTSSSIERPCPAARFQFHTTERSKAGANGVWYSKRVWSSQLFAARAACLRRRVIGPFAQRGLDEAFCFAVGSRGIGSGSDMSEFQSSAQFCEAFRAVAGAVVHNAGEGDSECSEVAQGVDERAGLERLAACEA